jgi:two-component system response regulator HydG
MLVHYHWPGNVRELENAIERGVILMRGDYLDEAGLPITVRKAFAEPAKAAAADGRQSPATLEEAERLVILKTMAETDGNKSEAARRLNITRKTLLSKLNKYDT